MKTLTTLEGWIICVNTAMLFTGLQNIWSEVLPGMHSMVHAACKAKLISTLSPLCWLKCMTYTLLLRTLAKNSIPTSVDTIKCLLLHLWVVIFVLTVWFLMGMGLWCTRHRVKCFIRLDRYFWIQVTLLCIVNCTSTILPTLCSIAKITIHVHMIQQWQLYNVSCWTAILSLRSIFRLPHFHVWLHCPNIDLNWTSYMLQIASNTMFLQCNMN